MIRYLYTLKSEFQEMQLYIWDVGRFAIETLSRLVYRGIRVMGFVTTVPEFAGQTLVNLPIVYAEELRGKENVLLAAHKGTREKDLRKARSYARCLRYPELLGLNREILRTPFYIYGTGGRAWSFLKEWQQALPVKGFLETRKTGPDSILGVPVFSLAEAGLTASDSVAILVRSEAYEQEILSGLLQAGFQGTIYLQDMLPWETRWGAEPFLAVDHAVRNGKRILLCSDEKEGSDLLRRALSLCGISIDREIGPEGDSACGAADIWALADEDPEKSVLLIHALSPARRADLIEAAGELGYSEGLGQYAGIQKSHQSGDLLTGRLVYESDVLLPYSVDFTPVGGQPGLAVYGEETPDALKILVLGGSTTTELFHTESWASVLQRLFQRSGRNCVIYNAAHEANKVADELVRLTRDLPLLKPDIVISMSGLNEFSRDCSRFERRRREDPLTYWLQMETCLKAVAETEGAAFYAFLQPMNTVLLHPDREEVTYYFPYTNFLKKNCGSTPDNDFFTNLSTLFHHKEGMFIDPVHYSDAGGRELARKVFQRIMEDLA